MRTLAMLTFLAGPVECSWVPEVISQYGLTHRFACSYVHEACHAGRLFGDGDSSVQRSLHAAARALGTSLLDHSLLFDILLPIASGRNQPTGANTAEIRSGAMNFVSAVLCSMTTEDVALYSNNIVAALANHAEKSFKQTLNGLCLGGDLDVTLSRAAETLIGCTTVLSYNATVALVRAVFLASTFFEASSNAEDLPLPSFATSRTLCMLATRHDAHSASKLMEIIFGDLIASLPETPPCYSSRSASWITLHALVHITPEVGSGFVDRILAPKLFVLASPSCCAEVGIRLQALSLTYELVSSSIIKDAFSERTISSLVERTITPNLIWSAGLTAGSTRI